MLFLASVGFWNFLGAGVFGFLINLPVVSYYEIGTLLTSNHGHAAFMGVYGMLAVGFMLFCLRYLVPEARWSDRLAKLSFWSLNLGLAWMAFVTLLPLFSNVGDHETYAIATTSIGSTVVVATTTLGLALAFWNDGGSITVLP